MMVKILLNQPLNKFSLVQPITPIEVRGGVCSANISDLTKDTFLILSLHHIVSTIVPIYHR